MPTQFTCPKCGQKATLTSSQPGDWIDCPNCEATVQVPGPAPAAKSTPTPVRRPVPEPPDPFEDELRSPWADKRVQAGVIGLFVTGLLVTVLVVKKPRKEPEVVRNDPPAAARPAPLAPPATKELAPKEAPPEADPPKKVPPEPKVEVAPDPRPVTRAEPEPKPEPKELVAVVLDQFGNPTHGTAGLAHQGEFKGRNLLVWCGEPHVSSRYLGTKNPFWKALEEMGFEVRKEFGPFDRAWLEKTNQIWLFSGDKSRLSAADYDAVVAFAKAGKGVCLLADNDPYVAEADALSRRLFGAAIGCDYAGTKIAYVRQRNLSAAEIKKYGGQYPIDDHPLLTGVNFICEGYTISAVARSDKLEVAMKASDGKTVLAVSKVPGLRVIVDCGFTRYCYGPTPDTQIITKAAGAARLAQNMAAYLAGKGAPKKP